MSDGFAFDDRVALFVGVEDAPVVVYEAKILLLRSISFFFF